MSEVSKSGKGIVNYFKTNEALVPRSFRRSVKEIFRLAKSGLVCMAWACVAFSGYLAFNPSQIPVEFRDIQGSIQEVGMQTIGDTDRLTVVMENGEDTTRFVKLGEVWVCPDDISLPVSAGLSNELDLVQQQYELDSSVDVVGREIKTFSILPQLK